MNTKFKNFSMNLLVDVVSGVLITTSIYCFAIPADFPLTGISGIALILHQLFQTPIGAMTILLNLPIALCCYRRLGRRFYLNSLRTILITSTIMDTLGPALPPYEGELLLAAVCSGVLSGIGYGIVFMRGSSTGGVDFITMTIRSYHPHISLGKIAFGIDCLIICIGGFLLKGIDAVIYGLILNYLLATVLDKVVYGTNYGKLAMIITDCPTQIAVAIDETANRGSTIIHASGAFSKKEKEVVLCACNNKEMYAIKKRAHEVDEHAFVIILESNEVIGEGFRIPGSMY